MTGHLTKKELQKDEVLEGAKSGLDWLKGHSAEARRAALIVGGVIVLVGGVAGFLAFRKHSASSLVSEAMAVADAPVGTAAPAPSDSKQTFPSVAERDAKVSELLEKAAKSYGSTGPGRAAVLDQAASLVAKGDTASAWKLLEGAANGGTGLIRSWAEYDLLLLAPAAGKRQEGIDRIRRHLDSNDSPLPKDVLLLVLGELHEDAGQIPEAKNAWQRIVTDFPDSSHKWEAQQKLQGL